MKRLPLTSCIVACLALLSSPREGALAQDLKAMDRSRAVYAALGTYSDSGSVVTESRLAGTPTVVERFTFRTSFKRPRQYLFEFAANAASGADRVALWCETAEGDFHSWWKATGVHDVHGNRTGINAFLTTAAPTKGTSLYLVSILLPQTALLASLGAFAPTVATRDTIGGRPHIKLSGEMKGHFGSGRPMAVWVDAESHLIRRIVEDTPSESPAGSVDRITTTFAPRANPTLGPAAFQYRIPGGAP